MPAKAKSAAQRCANGVRRRTKAATTMASRQMDRKEERARERAESRFSGETRTSRVAQEGTLMTLLTLGIIGIIGVLIYSQVSSSLPEPENDELANTTTEIDSGFADAVGLLPVVLIVMMAALVIAVVQRFRG